MDQGATEIWGTNLLRKWIKSPELQAGEYRVWGGNAIGRGSQGERTDRGKSMAPAFSPSGIARAIGDSNHPHLHHPREQTPMCPVG